MQYKEDERIDLSEWTAGSYLISSQHRIKGNPNKSIWTISHAEEVDCFIQAFNKNWKSEYEAWGIKLSNKNLEVVGENQREKKLKLAKFVNKNKTDANYWHGYPADYMNKAQDRPTTNILKEWVADGYLTKAKMRKIRNGQSCNL